MRADVCTPRRELPWCDAPMSRTIPPPAVKRGAGQSGVDRPGHRNRQAEASPPGPPLIGAHHGCNGRKNSRGAACVRLCRSSCQTRPLLFQRRTKYRPGMGRASSTNAQTFARPTKTGGWMIGANLRRAAAEGLEVFPLFPLSGLRVGTTTVLRKPCCCWPSRLCSHRSHCSHRF
jgi:hypothetical protein